MPRVPVLLLLVLAALVLPATAEAAGPPVVRGSVEQVQVTGAEPGASVRLVDRRGRSVATQAAGALGGAVFRTVRPGRGLPGADGRLDLGRRPRALDALGAAEHGALRPGDPGQAATAT